MIRKLKRYLEQCDMQSVELMVLSLAASAFNYVFQLMLGRLLTVAQYGEYNAVNSLISNMLNFFTPLTITACRITAEKMGMRKANTTRYMQIIKAMCIVSAMVLVGGGVVYPTLNGAYCSNSIWSWSLVLGTVIMSAVYSLILAIIQGCKMFRVYGWVGLVLIWLKIALSYISIQCGFGVVGCVFALLMSNFLLATFSLVILNKNKVIEDSGEIIEQYRGIELVKGYGSTFIVGMIYSLYINGGEIMLLNHSFESEEVGLYSAIAALGKISFFVVSIVFVIILPNVAAMKDDYLRLKKTIRKALIISGLLAVGYAIVYQVLGQWLISILYGEIYAKASYLIIYVNIYVILISIMGILHNVLIGLDQLKAYMVCLALIILATILVAINFATSIQSILIIVSVSSTIIIVSQMYIIRMFMRKEE